MEKLGSKERLKQFLWNSETCEVMGRTGRSWAKIIGFYVIFYAGLAAFFGVLLSIFFLTLDENEPKLKLKEGTIGSSPGLGFRPLPTLDMGGSFSNKDASNEITDFWISELDEFLKVYENQDSENYMNCSSDNPPTDGKVCRVNITENFGNCTKENYFGLPHSPCFFIKLNKIYGWQPEFYNKTEFESLNKTVRENIANDKNELNTIWVSCERIKCDDTEKKCLSQNLTINYYPQQGFPGYYYPYKNQKGYLSPLIAVNFENVDITDEIEIECKAWAKNLEHNKDAGHGLVRFKFAVNDVMKLHVGS